MSPARMQDERRASGGRAATIARFAAVTMACGWLAACANLAPKSDPTRFYTLSAPLASAGGSSAAPADDAPVVGVRVSQLADYLRRPGMVVRTSSHEIKYADADRWADRLDGAISRALAEGLAPLVADTAEVTIASAVRAPIPPVVIDMDVLTFDARAGDAPAALVTIEWRVFAGDRPAPIETGRFQLEKTGWRAGDYGHFAELAGSALDELAASLVDVVKKAVAIAREDAAAAAAAAAREREREQPAAAER